MSTIGPNGVHRRCSTAGQWTLNGRFGDEYGSSPLFGSVTAAYTPRAVSLGSPRGLSRSSWPATCYLAPAAVGSRVSGRLRRGSRGPRRAAVCGRDVERWVPLDGYALYTSGTRSRRAAVPVAGSPRDDYRRSGNPDHAVHDQVGKGVNRWTAMDRVRADSSEIRS